VKKTNHKAEWGVFEMMRGNKACNSDPTARRVLDSATKSFLGKTVLKHPPLYLQTLVTAI